MTIYTIGHSTRPIDAFTALLHQYGIVQLVDIRTVPKSLHNPQFGQDELHKSLEKADIQYVYMKDLGGLRPKVKESHNLGWHNDSFRNYADYMQTNDFAAAIEKLIAAAKSMPTAIMCAEAVPWRCHRSLVGDALLTRDIEVIDIISETSAPEHKLTKFAEVHGTDVTYPDDASKR